MLRHLQCYTCDGLWCNQLFLLLLVVFTPLFNVMYRIAQLLMGKILTDSKYLDIWWGKFWRMQKIVSLGQTTSPLWRLSNRNYKCLLQSISAVAEKRSGHTRQQFQFQLLSFLVSLIYSFLGLAVIDFTIALASLVSDGASTHTNKCVKGLDWRWHLFSDVSDNSN